METDARYLTIGGFTLAAILSCLGFVFWLNQSGGLAHQQTVQVRFGNQVSGLQPGAAVLFDGMRVGSVAALAVDPSDPRHVLATLAVSVDTPIRQDTRVGIASQGLMGNVAVSLQGGDPAASSLPRHGDVPPTLVADPAASRSLTQSAQETLGRVDDMLAANAEPLKATVDNLKVFTGALARNADRLDAVMAGLAQLSGAGPAKQVAPVYDLTAPKLDPIGKIPPGQIVIGTPSAAVALQTQRLLTRSPDGQLTPVGEMQWSDALPNLLQQKIAQSLDDAKLVTTLVAPTDYGKDDRQLQLELRRFDVAASPERTANVTFAAKLLSGDGHVLDRRLFEAEAPATGPGDLAAVKGLNAAFGTTAAELVIWIAGTRPSASVRAPAL